MRSGRWKGLSMAVSMTLAGALLLSACGSGKSIQSPASEGVPTLEKEEQEQKPEQKEPQKEESSKIQKEEAKKEESGKSAEKEEQKEEMEEKETKTASGMVVPELTIAEKDLPSTEAMEFVRSMKVGWNLGNTLEAHNGTNPGNELSTETCWGNPKTTKEMIDAVKEAGFNTVRIPVTWFNHVQKNEDGSYIVSKEWLDRVQEVVDYAYDSGMYVILNTHHDVAADHGYYPDEAHYGQSEQFLKSVWTAMAERFQDYDEHLIMESLNEPRLTGTGYEWNFSEGAAECKESAECINRLNQLFVDVVRSTGGNNTKRYLMVPGYAASPAGALSKQFVLPTDTAEGRLIVSIHAYIPYPFALQPLNENGVTDRFNLKATVNPGEINRTFDQLYIRFVSKGIPVVVGEFGARNKNDNLQERVDYYAYYIVATRARGISCCIWDNGIFGGDGEQFGLLKRESAQWIYPDIVEAIMKYA